MGVKNPFCRKIKGEYKKDFLPQKDNIKIIILVAKVLSLTTWY